MTKISSQKTRGAFGVAIDCNIFVSSTRFEGFCLVLTYGCIAQNFSTRFYRRQNGVEIPHETHFPGCNADTFSLKTFSRFCMFGNISLALGQMAPNCVVGLDGGSEYRSVASFKEHF